MDPEPLLPSSVRHVAVVGTGVIGSGWAAVFLAKGYAVTAFVRSDASEKKFHAFLEKAWRPVFARGLSADAAGWKRVKCVRSLAECVSGVDYVQESVVEDLILKQQIIAEIDQFAPPHVVVGTSSSFIPASLCAAKATRFPHRVATAHPTLPQFDPFVEIFGMTTAVKAWLIEFFGPKYVGMDVVVVQRENHGHVLNAVTNSVCSTSTLLINTGVCSASDVDRSLVHLGRMIVSSGGISGAMVGFVGGGSTDATSELASDIIIGAPIAVGACLIRRLLGYGRVATFVLYLLQCMTSLYMRSQLVKRLVVKFAGWWNRYIYVQWHEMEDGWEQRNIKALVALEAIPPV